MPIYEVTAFVPLDVEDAWLVSDFHTGIDPLENDGSKPAGPRTESGNFGPVRSRLVEV